MTKIELNKILLERGLRLSLDPQILRIAPGVWSMSTVPKFRDAPPQTRYVSSVGDGFRVLVNAPPVRVGDA